MSRFADWRERRRTASRRTAPAGRWPPGSNGVAPATTLAPDTASHLSDGVVVQTQLVARLLGLRVLRVDGVVHLAPARLEMTGTAARPAPESQLSLGADLARASRLLADGDRRLGDAVRHGPSLSLAPPWRAR